jgi:phosphatidate cytidylyltransferase
MRQRLISAAVLVPVVVIVFLLGQPWLTIGIALLVALAAWEAARLLSAAGLRNPGWLSVILATGLAVVIPGAVASPSFAGLLANPLPAAFGILALLVILPAISALARPDPADGLRAWVAVLVASFYPALLAYASAIVVVGPAIDSSSLLGSAFDAGRVWLLILVASVWSLDSAAYLAGRYHGRGRFMSHISPSKTWSGVVGGTAACVLVCALLVDSVNGHWWGGALLGLLIAVAAQAGDLAESVLKRAAGAKDSGNLIPGHGGILDRVDSFLFAAPAMFLAIALMPR